VNENVEVDRLSHGGVLRLAFSRDRGNVLTSALLARIDEILAEHTDDPHLKLVMLEGVGKNFSVGASIDEHKREHVAAMLGTFHHLVRRLVTYPIATAALVRGRCLGGAFEVALSCNFVIAANDATFACPEIALGVFPPTLAALGPLRLGASWAERLALTGEDLDAETARSLGFVTELVPDGTDVLEHALAWFDRRLAKRSAFALRRTLDAVRTGSGVAERVTRTLAEIERLYIERVVPSFDGNEGIEAFVAKREAHWKDA
jgi:cyclohexa-1,5-dienecarbonyl-CoA hydratase